MPKNDYLLDTLALCVKWRKAICLQVAGVCLIALVFCFMVPEWYKSEARIIPPSGEEGTSFLSSLMSQIPLSSSLFGMAGMSSSASLSMAVLESRSMMESTVQAFDLVRRYRAKNIEKAVRILKKRCAFNLDEKGIIRISVAEKTRYFHSAETTRQTKSMARDMVTFMVNRLDSVNRTLANEKARGIRIFYEKRYSENLALLQSYEENLRRIQEKYGTVALPQQTIAAIAAAARMKADLMAKEMEIGVFNQNFGPNNTNTRKAQVELDYLKIQYNRLYREDPLDPDKLLPGFQSIPSYALDYARSIRNIKVQEILVELLLNQLEQARLQELKDTPTIQVLDPANLPVKKTRPQRALVMVLAFLFSMTFSMFTAVLVEKTRGMKNDKSPRSETFRWMARELSGDLKKLRLKKHAR
jgi:tyrosine-protein kinase Etk/Wzc